MNALFGRRILIPVFFLAVICSQAWATITVSPPAEQFPDAMVGQIYSQQFFSNAIGVVTWSIVAGSLPAGVTLNPSTGLASGQLLQSGPWAFAVQAATSTDSGSTAYGINVTSGPLGVNTNSFSPRASTNAPYSAQLGGVGGSPPYTWALASTTGNNGLSLTNNGLITGTPSSGGVTTLNVVLTDSARTVVDLPLTIFVIGITTTTLPSTVIGANYSQTLGVSGAQLPATWSVTGANPLPPGFALSSQGVLAGAAVTNGVYNFTVTVTDNIQNSASVRLTLAVGATFGVTTTSLPDAAAGVNYSQLLQAAGGTPPYTWSATGLPPGITLNPSSGLLQGTSTAPSTQTIAVTVTDSTLATAHASLGLNVDTLAISNTSLPSGVVGTSYSAALTVSGGQTSLLWAITAGALPNGLALNSTSGAINGTPSAAGNSTFTVTVTYTPSGINVQKQFSIQISLTSGFTITTNATLPAGAINTAYSQTLTATGGTAPYRWTLVAGSLPAGLTLSTSGTITGTPLTAGTSSFTIGVTDSTQSFLSQVFSLTILPTSLDFSSALRIAQIVDGGNFITEFAIVNLDALPVSYQFRFWGDDGSALNLPIQNGVAGTLSGTLDSGAIAFAQSIGTSAPSTAAALQGWAEAAATGRIGVAAIFKRSVPGSPDSEATVGGIVSSGSVSLPFDNTQGYATGVAVANTNALQAITITAVFEFENGGSFTAPIALNPHAHTAFVLPTAYPATSGLRGVIHFTAFSPDISVVGLRFSPNNSFTSLGSFQ